jgi:prepilin-type N-terminal cleavage/methylation domain-containing protein
MRKKGFTLVELLVVIAIIALLMGILMPALARVRQLAFRMTCGTNLAGIGKAMLIYANDYEDELPKAGARNNTWANSVGSQGSATNWLMERRHEAYGTNINNSVDGTVSTSSSLYLLVRFAEVTPKSFVCKGESDSKEFKLSEWDVPADKELVEVWDFGYWKDATSMNQAKHCSYGYHVPFGSYALTVAHEPTMGVAADRNPWLDPAIDAAEIADRWSNFQPDDEIFRGQADDAKLGNSAAHQGEGQNVLFLDSHVAFEKRSFVGIENDNIYTRLMDASNMKQAARGEIVQAYNSTLNTSIKTRRDTILVQETAGSGSSGGGGGGRGR